MLFVILLYVVILADFNTEFAHCLCFVDTLPNNGGLIKYFVTGVISWYFKKIVCCLLSCKIKFSKQELFVLIDNKYFKNIVRKEIMQH